VPLRGALSSENIRVNVPSVFTVAIDTRPEVMQNAAVRLLGLTTGEVRKQAEEMIFGQLRQVIASMGIEEINRDRDKFLEHVQHSLEPNSQDRFAADQRQYHRHYRRIGIYRRHRPEGRLARHSTGPRRCRRQRENG
jgi:hypothetical protein